MAMTEYRSYAAEATVQPYHIVKFGSSDGTVVPAAAATDALIGTSDGPLERAAGEAVDVAAGHVHEVLLAGTVVRGGPITSNGSGRGVAAAPAAGANVRIIGFAEQSGVSGDVIRYRLDLGVMQG